jgi:MoaA/NifB/PqqE/SkfB family radical SAM enzyme
MSCWHSDASKRKFKIETMPYEDVMCNIEYFKVLGCKSIKFNLRGEPFLNEQLEQYLRYAKELGYVDVMLNTNLTCNKQKLIKCLPYIDTLIVSLDSYESKTYNKLHGTDNDYIKLLYNLRILSELSDLGKLNTRIRLNYHVNKYNALESHPKTYMGFKINYRYTQNREGQNISIKLNDKRKSKCPHMMRRVAVMANGKMYPCCVCYNEPEDIRIDDNRYFGNHFRDALIDTYSFNMQESCKNCTSQDVYK